MSDSRADMSLANVAATCLAKGHSQDVIKKFHWAIKRVASEHGNENDTALTQEELIELIRVWEPHRDIICLYVRWVRQLRRNFNLDSIATLLCLSRPLSSQSEDPIDSQESESSVRSIFPFRYP